MNPARWLIAFFVIWAIVLALVLCISGCVTLEMKFGLDTDKVVDRMTNRFERPVEGD